MALDKYRSKRDFHVTPEPAARGPSPRGRGNVAGGRFVVQLHDARRMHCDFRLAWDDGTLRSWAVPKGPSLDPAVKRLAVQVEDHPAEYADFEGEIPAGQYGGGRVIVWDEGRWFPKGNAVAGYDRGNLKFSLQGRRLNGDWALVRIRRSEGGRAQWLLLKERDSFARRGEELKFDRDATSVLSGRTLETVGAPRTPDSMPRKAPRPRRKTGHAALPAALECQLATEADAAPTGDGWWFETKFDGYRLLARITANEVRLLSRSGRDWTQRFPALAGQLAALELADSWLDGEVVVLDERGLSRFQHLQNALERRDDRDVRYFVFDTPFLHGEDLRARPLVERKERLDAALAGAAPGRVAVSPHVLLDAHRAHRDACDMGFEGLIAKRMDGPYRAGRSQDWLKLKCRKRQEFVVVGYTEPAGSRAHFGALLLAYRDGARRWRFAGRVGTGFTGQRLAALSHALRPLAITKPVLEVPHRRGVRVHWVRPKMVVEVEFADWTDDGLVRQASFVGIREDKSSNEVTRERATKRPASARAARRRGAKISANAEGLRVTHPERIVFPADGALTAPVTKNALAQYYVSIAPFLLTHAADRPLALVRAPEGLHGAHFFQKHLHGRFPDGVKSVPVSDSHGTPQEHLCVRDSDGLVSLVQMGGVELHGWGCRAPRIEKPDRLVFDLDPDESIPWARVVEAAELTRTVLEGLRLRVLLMTTGGKGLHLVSHIAPRTGWDIVEAFTKAVAEHIAGVLPALFTASPSKAKRRGRIFIDYLRNQRGATAVMPYSVRLRAGATVATPITWQELRDGLRPAELNVETVAARLHRRRSDAWHTPLLQSFNVAAGLRRLQRLSR